jgi:hypothetical protein
MLVWNAADACVTEAVYRTYMPSLVTVVLVTPAACRSFTTAAIVALLGAYRAAN